MTQQEFETLYGKKVGENEFEVINAMYMLDDNETKQQFVARYKKMGKDELMDAYIRLNSNSKKYTDGLNKQIKELAGRATVAEQTVTELIFGCIFPFIILLRLVKSMPQYLANSPTSPLKKRVQIASKRSEIRLFSSIFLVISSFFLLLLFINNQSFKI